LNAALVSLADAPASFARSSNASSCAACSPRTHSASILRRRTRRRRASERQKKTQRPPCIEARRRLLTFPPPLIAFSFSLSFSLFLFLSFTPLSLMPLSRTLSGARSLSHLGLGMQTREKCLRGRGIQSSDAFFAFIYGHLLAQLVDFRCGVLERVFKRRNLVIYVYTYIHTNIHIYVYTYASLSESCDVQPGFRSGSGGSSLSLSRTHSIPLSPSLPPSLLGSPVMNVTYP
jgi:hypothetical protein